jgi:hypothetical protein
MLVEVCFLQEPTDRWNQRDERRTSLWSM